MPDSHWTSDGLPAARIIVHERGCAGTTFEKHLAALGVMKSNLIEVEY